MIVAPHRRCSFFAELAFQPPNEPKFLKHSLQVWVETETGFTGVTKIWCAPAMLPGGVDRCISLSSSSSWFWLFCLRSLLSLLCCLLEYYRCCCYRCSCCRWWCWWCWCWGIQNTLFCALVGVHSNVLRIPGYKRRRRRRRRSRRRRALVTVNIFTQISLRALPKVLKIGTNLLRFFKRTVLKIHNVSRC